MDKHLVSCIVPVYNSEDFLSRCLNSIKLQSYTNFEVIVVDDGSVDRSKEIISSYLVDKRFNYIYKQNGGASSARNVGIGLAKGEFIVFIDSDDWLEQEYLKSLLEEGAGTDIVVSGYIDHSKYNNYLELHDFAFEIKKNSDKEEFIKCFFKGVGGVPWAKMYRTEIIKTNGLLFDPTVVMSEDLIFNLQFIAHVKTTKVVSNYYYHYNRLNENSITWKVNVDYLTSHLHSNELIKKFGLEVGLDSKFLDNWVLNRMKQFFAHTIVLISINSKKSVRERVKSIENIIHTVELIFPSEKIFIRSVFNLKILINKGNVLWLVLLNIFINRLRELLVGFKNWM